MSSRADGYRPLRGLPYIEAAHRSGDTDGDSSAPGRLVVCHRDDSVVQLPWADTVALGRARNRVYADDRDVTGGRWPDRGWDLRNRGFGIQFNRLFRF